MLQSQELPHMRDVAGRKKTVGERQAKQEQKENATTMRLPKKYNICTLNPMLFLRIKRVQRRRAALVTANIHMQEAGFRPRDAGCPRHQDAGRDNEESSFCGICASGEW